MSTSPSSPDQPLRSSPQGWFAAPPQGPPLPQGFATLAKALSALIAVSALAELATAAAGMRSFALLGEVGSGRAGLEDDLATADRLATPLLLLSMLLLLAAGIVWLVWQHRLASSSRVDRRELRRSPGWHVGSWFIPVVSLWLPYQNVADLHRGLGAFSSREQRPPLLPWWLAWIGGSVLGWVSNVLSNRADGLAEGGHAEDAVSLLRSSLALDLGAALLTGLAAVLAIMVVRNLTARATRPADTPWTSPDTTVPPPPT
ncbi:DUF4328 domain-containing protein [Arsenicicoccus sp. oral taxon 190]|uniref:DUF4328 domain-containing protein n=1 Tax=Arsenicicoccus sp. oral taxon 190 TaxID=1658671 RepID=UPI000679FC15|nr:DUF4328 domain-containing protein [Arsenicicoccus sp. oral taxon 190]AKT51022.1 hypothetical protein ADJ73_06315 [Arsenicicoccus sp. oral taxon 190]